MDKIRDRLWKKAGHMGIPLTGAFELLPMCNLSCKMCYVRKSAKEVNELGGLMDAKQWLSYAKECYELGMLYPLITGGEPLLHPDFKEIYMGMQTMGMQVSINSNGTMIDKEMAEWFSHHCPTRINITLYGASEETYQKLCDNRQAFYKVREAVKWLQYYKIPIKFNTSITEENIDDLDAIMKYAKEVNVPIQVATYMFPPIRRNHSMIGQNDRLSAKKAGYAKVKADLLQTDKRWFLGQTKRFSCFVDPKTIDFDNLKKQELSMTCRAGYSSLWIDWQGNMMNCGMYASAKKSLKNLTVKEAWEKIREDTFNVKFMPVCSGCPNRQLCHSCIAMVNNECGNNYGRPEYLCEMNYAASKYYQEFAKKYYKDIDLKNIDFSQVIEDECDIDKY